MNAFSPVARPHEILLEPTLLLKDSIVFYALLGLLMLGPLMFGTVDPWAVFLLEAATAILFIVWTCQQLFSASPAIAWNPVFAPMCAFLFLTLMQLVLRRSAYAYATLSDLELYIAYGLLCFLMTQSLRAPEHLKILASVLSVYGLVVATFSLIQGLSPNGKIYWVRVPRSGGWIYGPYVNHNHYAGLMEMLFPIPLVFLLIRDARRGQRTLAVVAACIMATTIVLSGSRGGTVALVVELVLFCLIFMWQARMRRIDFRSRWQFSILAILLIGMLAWFGSGALKVRLISTNSDLSTGMRLQIDRDLIRMFPKRPILGWGLGTFEDVYPRFRSFPTSQSIDEAHNSYLQMLVEMGAAGVAVAAWLITLLFTNALKQFHSRNADITRAMVLASLLGVAGILVHSCVDFNLQVPANAALFYVLCTVVSSSRSLKSAATGC